MTNAQLQQEFPEVDIDKIAKGKVGSGEKPEPREVKAYQVEYLPDLTKAELEAMKKDKTMRDVTIKDED